MRFSDRGEKRRLTLHTLAWFILLSRGELGLKASAPGMWVNHVNGKVLVFIHHPCLLTWMNSELCPGSYYFSLVLLEKASTVLGGVHETVPPGGQGYT